MRCSYTEEKYRGIVKQDRVKKGMFSNTQMVPTRCSWRPPFTPPHPPLPLRHCTELPHGRCSLLHLFGSVLFCCVLPCLFVLFQVPIDCLRKIVRRPPLKDGLNIPYAPQYPTLPCVP